MKGCPGRLKYADDLAENSHIVEDVFEDLVAEDEVNMAARKGQPTRFRWNDGQPFSNRVRYAVKCFPMIKNIDAVDVVAEFDERCDRSALPTAEIEDARSARKRSSEPLNSEAKVMFCLVHAWITLSTAQWQVQRR